MASAPRFAPRLGLVITDERHIGRGRASDGVELVILRTSLLSMPRSAGARRSAERIAGSHPEAARGLFAWHYVTHAADDALPGRGTRTVDLEGRPCGHLRDEPGVGQAWSVTRTALGALGGQHVVLRTPPSFSPGTLSRRRLEGFVGRAREQEGEELSLAWEAEGIWSVEEMLELGAALELAVILPALSSAGRAAEYPLDGGLVWRRVGGMGARPELSAAAAEVLAFELADAWADGLESGVDEATAQPTLLFEGELGHANLRRFRRALELV